MTYFRFILNRFRKCADGRTEDMPDWQMCQQLPGWWGSLYFGGKSWQKYVSTLGRWREAVKDVNETLCIVSENIKIKFFELDDEDNEIWCDFAKFSELDVHHQYAIVFRTPPYRHTDIEDKVDVYLQLYRPTDGDSSEPIRFQYNPAEKLGKCRAGGPVSG